MADTTNPTSFEEIVEWAYSTLPQKIRRMPDFPGIQVVDEPPAEVLEDISSREKWPRGTELPPPSNRENGMRDRCQRDRAPHRMVFGD